jgi:hypothetical protein
MPSTPWVPQVSLVVDGQTQVSAEDVNPILEQLIQREQYLYEKFADANDLSVLTAFGQQIHPDEVENNTITAGLLQIGYFANDADGVGVKRAITSLSTSPTTSTFAPNNSSYPFGIISTVYADNTVDLWIQGLATLPTNIDDPTNGMLDFVATGTPETFRVGPYYLSQKTPGKITANPSGVNVLVGYALSKTLFLLNPSVNQLSQLFINFRFNMLDRPTAVPVLTTDTWTIPNSNMARLGWVDVNWLLANNPSALSGYTVPAGAQFFYNIPAAFTTDEGDNAATDGVANGTTTFTSASANFTSPLIGNYITIVGKGKYTIVGVNSTHSLTLDGIVATGTALHYSVSSVSVNEETEQTDLFKALPPQPADFSILTVNGVQQGFRDDYNPTGIYSIDQYGIWWFYNAADTQPWSSDLASGWAPANWPTNKGADDTRPHLFINFIKFNPSFKNLIVSSLAPYVDDTNNTSASITFVDKTTLQPSTSGDLLLKFAPQFNANVTPTSAASAVSDFLFDSVSGKFTKTIVPVVSSIAGAPNSGILVTPSTTNPGQFIISYQAAGISGQVYDMQPQGAEMDFFGNSSHTYLKFPNIGVPRTYGVVGKIILPEYFPAQQQMYIVLHLIGSTNASGANINIGWYFSYNVSTVINGAAPPAVLTANSTGSNAILSTDSTPTLVTTPLPSNYVANQAYKIKTAGLSIPMANIGPDSVVNFRLTRSILGSNNYAGDVGLLAAYWSIAP